MSIARGKIAHSRSANLSTLKSAHDALKEGDRRVSRLAAEELMTVAENHGGKKAHCVASAAKASAIFSGRKTVLQRDVKIAARVLNCMAAL